MKKLFLIPLLACFFCIGAYADGVAKIGNTEYASVKEAIAAVEDGVETRIDLIADVVEQLITVPAGKNIIFNLNGHSLSTDYDDGDQSVDGNSAICNYGNLKIVCEGNGFVSLPVGNEKGFPVVNHGTLIINGGLFIGALVGVEMGVPLQNPCVWTYDGNTTINGGTFVLAQGGIGCWQGILGNTGEGASTVVNGGKFSAAPKAAFLATGCSMESVSFSNVLASWVSSVQWVKPAGTESITENTTIDEENNEQEAVFVAANTTLTVPEGQILTITKDLAFKDATSQLVIEPEATVIIGDEVVTGSTNNIALTIDDKNRVYSNLLVAAGELQESHPKATVDFGTKAKYSTAAQKFIWQRFAVPTHATFNYESIIQPGVLTEIQGWDYENNCWKVMGPGSVLEPFQMYALTISSLQDTAHYLFPCELVGNGNPDLTIREGWNYFANAYTAPMNLKAWLVDLLNDPEFDGVIDGTIYVQRLQESNAWSSVTAARAKKGQFGSLSPELQPMQAFIYHATANTTIPLKYKEYVYDPIVNPAGAPARKEAQEEEYTEATIIVTPAVGEADYLYVYEGADFSEAFDNGFDATKFPNKDVLNAYFETVIGDLSDYATNDLNNAALTIKTAEESEITISFEDVTLENYFLVDSETETKTEIKSGNSYVFVGAANTTYSQRFSIVKEEEPDPSAVENVDASQKKNGIYTLTGQYMGNSLNALPKGVYIINGQKVVR